MTKIGSIHRRAPSAAPQIRKRSLVPAAVAALLALIGARVSAQHYFYYGEYFNPPTVSGPLAPAGHTGGVIIRALGGSASFYATGSTGAVGDIWLQGDVAASIGNGGTTGSIVSNVVLMGGQGYNGTPTLVFNRSNSWTYGGAISGQGFMEKKGAGTLVLTGDSTYSHYNNAYITPYSTKISGGTLSLGDGGTSGSIIGNVENNGILTFNRSDDITFTGAIDGTGSVEKRGAGALVLTANNNFTGKLAIFDGGYVAIGAGGTTGSLAGNVEFAAGTFGTLAFNRSDASAYVGVISGSNAAVEKLGSGNLTLTGANTYARLTTVRAGTLTIGDGGNSGSIATNVDVQRGGVLAFNRSDNISFSKFIDGAGALAKQGTGNLTLTNDNTYRGGTVIAAGRLTIGDGSTSGSIIGDVVNNGELAFNQQNATGFAGVISGTGTLLKQGGGTLTLTGANTYAGGTTIEAGRLVVGNGATGGWITGNVVNNGALAFNRSDARTFADAISGTGTLLKQGGGTLTLTGANTYAGGTRIEAGRLVVGNGTTGGWITGNVVNSGTLALNRSDDRTFVDAISGAGALVKQGNGTLTLTGTNSYTGGTTIEAGRLVVGNGTTSGRILGDVVNNGTLAFNRADAREFSGAISGTGALLKQGGGTLTLTRTNTYTGGTTIEAGRLVVGNGTTGGWITGNVVNNGTLAFNRSDARTFADAISGTGTLLKQGGGTLTLTGANTYTGGTTIEAGRLVVGNGTTSGWITGNVVNSGTLALNRSDDRTFVDAISGTGALVKQGNGTLTLTGTNTFTGDTRIEAGRLVVGNGTTNGWITGNVVNNGTLAFNHSDGRDFSGVISGTGALVKQGGGALTLTRTNTYAGGTTIEAGRLVVGNGAVGGWIRGNVVNNGTLSFNRSDAQTFADTISGMGTLVKQGSGTLTLTGTNTYAGATLIEAGQLVVGNGATQGWITTSAVFNNGTLIFNRTDDVTFNGSITGSGSLVKQGDGTLTLARGYVNQGTTTIAGGTLSVRVAGAERLINGPVINNGQLWIQADSGSFSTIPHPISGTGSLLKTGVGTLSLEASNSFTGGTTVDGGVVSVTLDGSNRPLPSDVKLKSRDAWLQVHTVADSTLDASVSGLGSLEVFGLMEAKTLTLLGDVAVQGTSRLNQGVNVAVGDGGTSGSIGGSIYAASTDTSLRFNRSDASQFTGTYLGAGRLEKLGAGTLRWTGTNEATGDTDVQNGELQVDGLFVQSATRVRSPAVLSGLGRMAGLVIEGTLAPGASVGLLSAAEASFLAGSRFLWELHDADKVAGVGYDTLVLDGVLDLSALGPSARLTVALKSLGPNGDPGVALNFDPSRSASFTLASAASIQGFDARGFTIDAAGFLNGTSGGTWSVSATDNDLLLNFTTAAPVPEPHGWALMLGGLAGLGALLRRRQEARSVS